MPELYWASVMDSVPESLKLMDVIFEEFALRESMLAFTLDAVSVIV